MYIQLKVHAHHRLPRHRHAIYIYIHIFIYIYTPVAILAQVRWAAAAHALDKLQQSYQLLVAII